MRARHPAGIAALVVIAVACSSTSTGSSSSQDAGTTPADGGIVAKADGATSGGVDAESPDATAADAGPKLGAVPIQSVPDTPCAARGGTPVSLYAASAQPPGLTAITIVGARNAAQGGAGEGFVLFDQDGSNPSAAPITIGNDRQAIASNGTILSMVGQSGADLVFQRFDALGAAVSSSSILASGPLVGWPAIAAVGNDALVTWTGGGAVHARGVTAGVPGTIFDMPGADATDRFTASAVPDGAGQVAVAWASNPQRGTFRARFAFITPSGVTSSRDLVSATTLGLDVTQMVRTPSGYAVLLGVADRGPKPVPHLLLLDAAGAPQAPIYRLDGAAAAFGIAVGGSDLGIVAWRDSSELEFRPFSASGTPLGPWVCLDSPTTGGDTTAGLRPDGTGWTVVYRGADQGEALVRFDHLGSGPP